MGVPPWMPDELATPNRTSITAVAGSADRKAAANPTETSRCCGVSAWTTRTRSSIGNRHGDVRPAAVAFYHRVNSMSLPSCSAFSARRVRQHGSRTSRWSRQFLSYQHQGAPAVVYSKNALHHLPDFWCSRWEDRHNPSNRVGCFACTTSSTPLSRMRPDGPSGWFAGRNHP